MKFPMRAKHVDGNLTADACIASIRCTSVFADRYIVGSLDLSRITLDHPLTFRRCKFRKDVILCEASFPQLSFVDCEISGRLTAPHLTISGGDLHLEELVASIDLQGAHIKDDLHLERAALTVGSDGHSLYAPNIEIGGNLRCGPTMRNPVPAEEKFSCEGKVDLSDSRIGGSVYLTGALFKAPGERCLYGDGMRVDGSVYSYDLDMAGQFHLIGATIGGSYEMSGSVIRDEGANQDRSALVMDRTEIRGSAFFERFTSRGPVKAVGGRFAASLYFEGATLAYAEDPNLSREEAKPVGLRLDRCVIDGTLKLTSDALEDRAIRAHICRNDPSVDRTLGEFRTCGEVSLRDARVGNEVQVDISGICGSPHELEGNPSHANCDVIIDCRGLRAPFLFIFGTPKPKPTEMLIDLTSAEIGVLWDAQGIWRSEGTDPDGNPVGRCLAAVKGLHYNAIHTNDITLNQRLKWVADSAHVDRAREEDRPHSIAYIQGPPAPEAYDELASAYRIAGFDAEVRRILYEKHSAILRFRWKNLGTNRKSIHIRRAWWACLGLIMWGFGQKLLIGFGYRPARALFWLLGLWGLGIAAFWGLPFHAVAVIPPGVKVTHVSMSVWDHLAFPFKLVVPVANFTVSNWRPASWQGVVFGVFLTAIGSLLLATVVTAVMRVAKRQ